MAEKIIYLNQKEQENSFKLFSEIIEFHHSKEVTQPLTFHKRCISIFDHWLNEEESEKYIITHSMLLEIVNNNKSDRPTETFLELNSYYQKEIRILSWFIFIFKNFNPIFFNLKRQLFYIYPNFENFIYACQSSIREEIFLDIYLPSSECMIKGNWDFTYPVYFKDLGKCQKLIDSAKEAGLFLLP